MEDERLLLLLEAAAHEAGVAHEPVYERLYSAIYDKLTACVSCGAQKPLGGGRVCEDCQRHVAWLRATRGESK